MAGESVPPAASKHLVFDLDGVLLDSESDRSWLDRALEAAVHELDGPASADVREHLYPPTVDGIRTVAARIDVEPDRLWRVRNEHYVRVKREAIQSGELQPFADVETLNQLAPHYELHIISNSPTAVVEAFVKRFGYDDLFEARIGRGDGLEALGRLKPDLHPYRRLVDVLDGETPDLYVGDTETDRAFAEATGMRFVHLTRDSRGLRSLEALPALLD